MLGHTFDINPMGFALPNFVTLLWSFGNRNDQILNSFVIDLHHRYLNFEISIGVLVFGNSGKYFLTRNGDDSLNIALATLLVP
jgi:hypothetical protein